jgi:hypothetical protein
MAGQKGLLFGHLSRGAEENYGKITHDNRCSIQDYTRERSEYLGHPKTLPQPAHVEFLFIGL